METVKNPMKSMNSIATGGKEDYLAYMKRLAMQKEQSATDSARAVRDQQVGRAESSYAENQRLAEEAYAKAAADYGSRMQNAKRDTNVQMARIEKFLPQMLSSQGLTGGVAQSTILDAYSRAASMRNDADGQYADAVLALDRDKATADTERMQVRDEAVGSAQSTYANALAQAAAQRASEEQTAYDTEYQRLYAEAAQKEYEDRQRAQEEAVNYLGAVEATVDAKAAAGYGDDGKLSPEAWEDLYAWASKQRETMPQAQQRELDAYLEQIRTDVREEEDNTEKTPVANVSDNKAKYMGGEDLTVTYGDNKKAIVMVGGKVKDAAVLEAGNNVEDGNIFLYKDHVYVKKGGVIHELNGTIRKMNDYKKLKSYLSSN